MTMKRRMPCIVEFIHRKKFINGTASGGSSKKSECNHEYFFNLITIISIKLDISPDAKQV